MDNHYSQSDETSNMLALLTGMYPFKAKKKLTNEKTMAEHLSNQGYITHLVGKWGLGKCALPTKKGFDSFHGFLKGGGDKFNHQVGSDYDFYYNEIEDKTATGNFTSDIVVERVQNILTNYLSQRELVSNNDIPGCIEYNIDYAGNDITDGTIANIDNFKDCQNLCFLRPDCNFWSWNPPSFASNRLLCQMKSSDSGRSVPSGKISGPKSCSGFLSSSDGDNKMFLLVSFQLPGPPLQVPQVYQEYYSYIKDVERRKYLGMVTAMDDAIGSIIKSLKANSLYEDTIFVMLPNTGGDPDKGGNNWPLRGGKGSLWEGGMRTPALVANKKLFGLQAGGRVPTLVHVTDWLPTILEAVGGQADLSLLDGVSHWRSWMENSIDQNRLLWFSSCYFCPL